MNTVSINTSKPYKVLIGSGILSAVGEMAANFPHVSSACIVSDDVVFPLYGNTVAASLQHAGIHVYPFVFPNGEKNKNASTYLDLLNFLAEKQLTRSDMIIALGGGVVGDLAGFAAATFLRGIKLIQIPTTLLAAVDSSVGGKTAIDLPAGKNLAGAFYQPSLVLCDIDTLDTLPAEIFRDGCAEVIKYGILYDKDLFQHLEEYGMKFNREWVVTRCVEMKRDAVVSDEFDTGTRMLLNLGHTIGHAVEKLTGFSVSHGCAVAIGTAIITRSAVHFGYCNSMDKDRILHLLSCFGLPCATSFTAHQLFEAALSDKKRTGSLLNLIIPRKIGQCIIFPTNIADFPNLIEAGL